MKNLIQVHDVSYDTLLNDIHYAIAKCLSEQSSKSEGQKLLTRKQLREKYSISYSTISRYMNQGLLIPYRIGGKVFFDQSQVEKAISPKIGSWGDGMPF